jgi:hypothetical protein
VAFKTFEDEMQENKVRSAVSFASTPARLHMREADAPAGSGRR